MKSVYRTLEKTTRLLTKEWERSGETKETLEIDIEQLRGMYERISQETSARKAVLDQMDEEIPYGEILKETHACYIMLRVAVKLSKLLQKAERKQLYFVKVKLDKEEYKMVKDIWNEMQ